MCSSITNEHDTFKFLNRKSKFYTSKRIRRTFKFKNGNIFNLNFKNIDNIPYISNQKNTPYIPNQKNTPYIPNQKNTPYIPNQKNKSIRFIHTKKSSCFSKCNSTQKPCENLKQLNISSGKQFMVKFLIFMVFIRSVFSFLIGTNGHFLTVVNHKMLLTQSGSEIDLEHHGGREYKLKYNGLSMDSKMIMGEEGEHFTILSTGRGILDKYNEKYARSPSDDQHYCEESLDLLTLYHSQESPQNSLCMGNRRPFLSFYILKGPYCLQANGNELVFTNIDDRPAEIASEGINQDDTDPRFLSKKRANMDGPGLDSFEFRACSVFKIVPFECDIFNFDKMFKSTIFSKPFSDNLIFLRKAVDMVDDRGIKGMEDEKWMKSIDQNGYDRREKTGYY